MITKEALTEIIRSQREWILRIPTGTERNELQRIKIRPGFALIISGIRRSGKSTLLSQILKKEKTFYYLNLEDPRLQEFDLSDFEKANTIFIDTYGKNGTYFFDEIQNVKKWEAFIRHLADRKCKIVVTGSNASMLNRELGTKLTGRHLDLQLQPFSYNEFLQYTRSKASETSFSDFLSKGGFPEYLKYNDPTILNELLSDVIMRDIVARFNIRNSSLLKRLAIHLISHVGKEFSFNSLKKTFQVKSVQTVIDYISFFEDSFLLFTVPNFYYSYKKQQVNPKKVYSIDNGFSTVNSVSFSKDIGKMLENCVFLYLRKRFSDIFFYSEHGECDFLIREKNKIMQAIQVCYSLDEENKNREINGLLQTIKQFKLDSGLVLTYNQEDRVTIDGKTIIVQPVWKWMLQ